MAILFLRQNGSRQRLLAANLRHRSANNIPWILVSQILSHVPIYEKKASVFTALIHRKF